MTKSNLEIGVAELVEEILGDEVSDAATLTWTDDQREELAVELSERFGIDVPAVSPDVARSVSALVAFVKLKQRR